MVYTETFIFVLLLYSTAAQFSRGKANLEVLDDRCLDCIGNGTAEVSSYVNCSSVGKLDQCGTFMISQNMIAMLESYSVNLDKTACLHGDVECEKVVVQTLLDSNLVQSFCQRTLIGKTYYNLTCAEYGKIWVAYAIDITTTQVRGVCSDFTTSNFTYADTCVFDDTTTPAVTTTTVDTTITPVITTTTEPMEFIPRPPSPYNPTECESATEFYGICQLNTLDCVNGTYYDGLCRLPSNTGQVGYRKSKALMVFDSDGGLIVNTSWTEGYSFSKLQLHLNATGYVRNIKAFGTYKEGIMFLHELGWQIVFGSYKSALWLLNTRTKSVTEQLGHDKYLLIDFIQSFGFEVILLFEDTSCLFLSNAQSSIELLTGDCRVSGHNDGQLDSALFETILQIVEDGNDKNSFFLLETGARIRKVDLGQRMVSTIDGSLNARTYADVPVSYHKGNSSDLQRRGRSGFVVQFIIDSDLSISLVNNTLKLTSLNEETIYRSCTTDTLSLDSHHSNCMTPAISAIHALDSTQLFIGTFGAFSILKIGKVKYCNSSGTWIPEQEYGETADVEYNGDFPLSPGTYSYRRRNACSFLILLRKVVDARVDETECRGNIATILSPGEHSKEVKLLSQISVHIKEGITDFIDSSTNICEKRFLVETTSCSDSMYGQRTRYSLRYPLEPGSYIYRIQDRGDCKGTVSFRKTKHIRTPGSCQVQNYTIIYEGISTLLIDLVELVSVTVKEGVTYFIESRTSTCILINVGVDIIATSDVTSNATNKTRVAWIVSASLLLVVPFSIATYFLAKKFRLWKRNKTKVHRHDGLVNHIRKNLAPQTMTSLVRTSVRESSKTTYTSGSLPTNITQLRENAVQYGEIGGDYYKEIDRKDLPGKLTALADMTSYEPNTEYYETAPALPPKYY